MESYKFGDIIWLITKRGVVIPVVEDDKAIKSILTDSCYENSDDKQFIYNCIVKDIFSEDELRSSLSYVHMEALPISKTLNELIEKQYDINYNLIGLMTKRKAMRLAYKFLKVSDKQVRIIKNEMQNHFIKQLKENENRTK